MQSKMKEVIKEYLMIALGTLLTSVGVYYFMAPQDIVSGGVSGFAIEIHHFLSLPISAITFILNSVLLIMGFLFLGKEFGLKTIWSMSLFSFFLYLMEIFTPLDGSITGLLWLDVIMSSVVSCYGISIVFNQNASTGGTDILARMFNKYLNLDLGTGLLLADLTVVTMAIFVFDLKTAFVGMFGWFLSGLSINYFIDGFNVKKEVSITTETPDKIKEYILHTLHRGLTIYAAEGGYTGNSKWIMMTVLDRNQYAKLKTVLKELDPNCFLIVRTVHEVMGAGFKDLE